MDIRRTYMAIVLFSALVVAIESVGVEAALNTFHISSYVAAVVPSIVGGVILISSMPSATRTVIIGLGRRGWAFMLATCTFMGLGVFMWFDAVGRIGASKEAILGGGSSEVLFIVLLSALFLSERLTRVEAAGSAFVLLGVFIVLANADTLSLSIGMGEVEAIASSFLLAVSVVMTAMLLKSHKLTPVSGLELLVSGALLLAIGIPFGFVSWPGAAEFLVLVGLGCFPALGMLAYYAGIPKIGASLTSVLFALNGIMTVGIQLLVVNIVPDAEMILPQSLPLTLLGGFVAFAGIYILNIGQGKPRPE